MFEIVVDIVDIVLTGVVWGWGYVLIPAAIFFGIAVFFSIVAAVYGKKY